MKKIEAIIRPNKLEELKKELNILEVRGMTVSNVMGRGLQLDVKQYYRGQEVTVDLFSKVKVEVVCTEESLPGIIDVIVKVCSTRKIGDGKIFIYPVEDVIRVSSGERGETAI